MQDRIFGESHPVVELILNPGESVRSWDADAAWMTDAIEFASPEGDARSWWSRLFSRRQEGNSSELVTFRAQSVPGMVAFAAPLPGEIVPLDVQTHANGGFVCAADALLCVGEGVEVSPLPQHALGSGLYGYGFGLVSLTGVGRAWVALGGTVANYDLRPDETMRVHPGHLGLVQETIEISVIEVASVRTASFPDGARLFEVTGPGKIWLCSLGVGPLAEDVMDFSHPVNPSEATVQAMPKARNSVREVLFPRP